MDIKQFSLNIDIIANNFNFKICPPDKLEAGKQWIKMLFRAASEFSDEDLKYGFQEMCRITQEEWNRRYGYGGKPAIADWVEFFEQRKKNEVREELDHRQYVALENTRRSIADGDGWNTGINRKEIEYDNSVSVEMMQGFLRDFNKKLVVN